MTLWRVALRARGEDVEVTRVELLELVPAGIEERALPDGSVELAAYVDEPQRAALLARFGDVRAEPVGDGWQDAWRAFHRPVEAGGLWLGPPWEEPPDRRHAVVIDPGRAFGTGAHPTTRLCVELLAAEARRGPVLDVGCGSGVLSIAAARLGFCPVVAIDNDPIAVEVTLANAAVNDVVVEARYVDALTQELPPAGLVVANVLLEPVERILARSEADRAITSGYLARDAPRAPAWRHLARRELDGWAADVFVRPAERSVDSTV
jgi:ribosomal protein L11 methyltransferase